MTSQEPAGYRDPLPMTWMLPGAVMREAAGSMQRQSYGTGSHRPGMYAALAGLLRRAADQSLAGDVYFSDGPGPRHEGCDMLLADCECLIGHAYRIAVAYRDGG